MIFLQPLLLFALPLIAAPVIIHLLNQRRHRTVHWAATQFLLRARKMAKGMARLKAWLILFFRTLAIAGLLLAVARPMTGGWLGWAGGGAPELTVILLDRSASVSQQDPVTGQTKLQTGLQRLATTFTTLGRTGRMVLIDSATLTPLEIDNPAALVDLPQTSTTATAADWPQLLSTLSDFLIDQNAGRVDVWMCSDLRESDWRPSDARWDALRAALGGRSGVRSYLLSYPEPAADNVSIAVTAVTRRETENGAELLLDLILQRDFPTAEPLQTSVGLVVNGARSNVEVEIVGPQLSLLGYRLPIDRELKQGGGYVELPHDANLADNRFEFVFAQPAVRRTVVVAEEEATGRLMRLAAAAPADPQVTYSATVLSPEQTATIDWSATALIVWQAPLPTGELARQMEAFVARGGAVLFLPPNTPTEQPLFGARWGTWQTSPANGRYGIARWRTDADLLRNTQSGVPLPIGQLSVFRACHLDCPAGIVLAQLEQGPPLLVHAPTDAGQVWFLATTPAPESSTLINQGVAFYVMVQRALSRGAEALSAARQMECGNLTAAQLEGWSPQDDITRSWLLSERSVQAGLYQSDDAWLALNRPLTEDNPVTLDAATLNRLLQGLSVVRIDDAAGEDGALASEVWKMFLVIMILALLAEAALSLPDKSKAGSFQRSAASFQRPEKSTPQFVTTR